MDKSANRIDWVKRKFLFQGIEGSYPNILERLSGTPIRIRCKIEGLNSELLKASQKSQWSIQVHIGHLLTLEALWMGRLDDFVNGEDELRPWQQGNLETEAGDFNSQNVYSILEKFEEARAKMMMILKELGGQEEQLISKHPRLGTDMRMLDLVYFIAEHDDHHLATMERIKTMKIGS